MEAHLESEDNLQSCMVHLAAGKGSCLLVLTQEKSQEEKISLCSSCYLCGEEAETVSHLFLQCRITIQLWRVFTSLKGIAWVMPNKITHLLYCWEEAGAGIGV